MKMMKKKKKKKRRRRKKKKKRRKKKRKKLMWWLWKSVRKRTRRRCRTQGTPVPWCWSAVTSPPTSTTTPPIPPHGMTSRLSRGYDWRPAAATTAAEATGMGSNASARVPGHRILRTMTNAGLTMCWSANVEMNSNSAFSHYGMRSLRLQITRKPLKLLF